MPHRATGKKPAKEPTEQERLQSFIYWAAWARNRRRLFKGSGALNRRAVAQIMGVHPANLGRVLYGQATLRGSPKIIEGLGKLAANADGPLPDDEVLYRIRTDYKPYPASAFAKAAKSQGKKKKNDTR